MRDGAGAPVTPRPLSRRGCAAALLALAGCTPVVMPAGPALAPTAIATDAFVMPDGARLPYRSWLPPERPRAIILAIHGFGDYSRNSLDIPAPLFLAQGIGVYAYDQRGFGAAPNRGYWPGAETLAADATAAARSLRGRHPGIPLILLGESMGAAVALVASAAAEPPPVDGYVLMAPGIRGRATMSDFSKRVLEFAARAIPAVGFSGSAPGFTPTDNDAAMRRWAEDPLTTKSFRVDAVYGLINLMDAALAAAAGFRGGCSSSTAATTGSSRRRPYAACSRSCRRRGPGTSPSTRRATTCCSGTSNAAWSARISRPGSWRPARPCRPTPRPPASNGCMKHPLRRGRHDRCTGPPWGAVPCPMT
ncbi:alpha/beta fold hydrolase [Paeniroseomonas aquatica]|uniref:alpha/beta fold hydrolase n=1 Tax=Paeniroseomonas aquatica TaxID=373043 RepID=UPI0036235222